MASRPERTGPLPAGQARSGAVWRVRTRADFDRLRRTGRTVRTGAMAVRFSPDPPSAHPTGAPRVAYAIGKPVGPAVVRNRLRRQIRHLVAELATSHHIPQGISLIIVQPEAAQLDHVELRAQLDALFAALRGQGERDA